MFTIKQMSTQLQVTNLERAIAFYTQKLGFEVQFRFEDFYAGIFKDGCFIHLKLNDQPLAPKAGEELEMMLTIDNIRQVYDELLAKGIHFTQTLRQMPYGSEFYIADPDGNVIAFFEDVNLDED